MLKSHFAKAPLAAQLCVAVAWTLGPLVGSWLAGHIARRAFFTHSMFVAFVFLAADIFNIRSLPHPTWLALVGVIAPLVMGGLGSEIAERTARKPPSGPRLTESSAR